VEAYTRQGFIDRVEVLPEAAMAGALAVVDRLERELGGRLPAQLLCPHLQHPELAKLALAPALLDTVSALLGPDLVLLSTALFTKYPVEEAGAQYVGAHQDLKYWGIVPLIAASAWVSLDGAGPHNGAMFFLPGSHRAGLLEHGRGDRATNVLKDNQDIALTEEQRSRLVQSHLQPGQASVHDGLTVHFSPPNESQGRRAGLAVIFVTPEVGSRGG
jgi:ectoine hydroxylase-related dioxygenase (phytanoyl-CoA dioxygenase family)